MTDNPQPDLPARLEAVLTERFTELGNPFSAMHRQEKGPDGWPASYPVGPHHVAEVLRELLAAAPAPGPSRVADEAQQPEAPRQWCKCPSCWGWFVEEHPGEDLDELGKDLRWWSGLPEHRDAPAAVSQPGKEA